MKIYCGKWEKKFAAAYWVPSAGAEATGGKLFSAEGKHNCDLILFTIYSTGDMEINTQDTNYSIGGMVTLTSKHGSYISRLSHDIIFLYLEQLYNFFRRVYNFFYLLNL